MNRQMKNIIILTILAIAAAACNSSEKVLYLQDVKTETPEAISPDQTITIQPKDMMSIVVSSKDPELSAMFNLPNVSHVAGSPLKTGGYNNLVGYVVDDQGDINFPIVGKVHAAGLNRWQLQEKLKQEMKSRNLLKDRIVTVEFMNFKVSVLGEVNAPGTYQIDGDKVTILEALAMAKDLTIHGVRSEVFVIREVEGKRFTYQLDLRSAEMFNSPAYYLKQNDIVYVRPDKVRIGESTLNQNSLKSAGLWISIASLLSSIGLLIANILD